MTTSTTPPKAASISNRRVGVQEMGVYGSTFNHVFFQRYGYTIPGYGTVASDTLRTSEFTHHDFFVAGDLSEVTAYYAEVLGFRPENDTVLDGAWQPDLPCSRWNPGAPAGTGALSRRTISAAN